MEELKERIMNQPMEDFEIEFDGINIEEGDDTNSDDPSNMIRKIKR